MPKLEPTPEIIENILARIPEGFIRYDMLCQRVALQRGMLAEFITDKVGRDGDWWYDPTRLTQEDMHQKRTWAKPSFPDMRAGGVFTKDSIQARQAARHAHIQTMGHAAQQIMEKLDATQGYVRANEVSADEGDKAALEALLSDEALDVYEGLVYDPLRLSVRTLKQLVAQEKLAPIKQAVTELLEKQAGQVALEAELVAQFGAYAIDSLLSLDVLKTLQVMSAQHTAITWLRLATADAETARKTAEEASLSSWENC